MGQLFSSQFILFPYREFLVSLDWMVYLDLEVQTEVPVTSAPEVLMDSLVLQAPPVPLAL